LVEQGFPPEAPTRGGQAHLPRAGTASGSNLEFAGFICAKIGYGSRSPAQSPAVGGTTCGMQIYAKFFTPHKNQIFRHRNKKTIKLCYEET